VTERKRRDPLAAVERAARLRGVSFRRERGRLFLALPDRELKLRARGGAGVIEAEAWIGGELDATVSLTEERAVALVSRVAET
jgi:hypothetical protein